MTMSCLSGRRVALLAFLAVAISGSPASAAPSFGMNVCQADQLDASVQTVQLKPENAVMIPRPLASKQYAIDVGDQLKITFYGRADISGEYTVLADGSVSVPLIGTVHVSGRSQREIQKELAHLLEGRTNRSTDVTVNVVKWRSFYVVGHVNNPGAYPFVPGMTVLKALAIAGGEFRLPVAEGYAVELTREEWARRRAVDQLKTSLARYSRLIAERSREATIRPVPRLLAIADEQEVTDLITLESRQLEETKLTYLKKSNALIQSQSYSKRELKAHREQLEYIKTQRDANQARLAKLEKLANQGVVRGASVFEINNRLSDLGVESTEVVARIAQTERAIMQSQQDRDMLQMEREKQITQELKQIEADIRGFEITIRGSEEAMLRMVGTPRQKKIQPDVSALKYRIVRSHRNETREFLDSEHGQIFPGDVLQVIPPQVSKSIYDK